MFDETLDEQDYSDLKDAPIGGIKIETAEAGVGSVLLINIGWPPAAFTAEKIYLQLPVIAW